MTPGQLIDAVKHCLVHDKVNEHIEEILVGIKGGWEVWFQVELALYAMTDMAEVRRVDREKTYPNSQQRCDLYFEAFDDDPTSKVAWLELKTQWTIDDLTLPGRFDADAAKIYNLQGNIRGADATAIAMAVGVAWPTEATLPGLTQYITTTPRPVSVTQLDDGVWVEIIDIEGIDLGKLLVMWYVLP